MTSSQRQSMLIVLLISTALVILNIFAVTSGTADGYYTGVKEWIDSTLLLPQRSQ